MNRWSLKSPVRSSSRGPPRWPGSQTAAGRRRPSRLPRDPLSALHRPSHPLGRVRQHDLRSEGPEHDPALHGHRGWHGEHELVALGGRHQRPTPVLPEVGSTRVVFFMFEKNLAASSPSSTASSISNSHTLALRLVFGVSRPDASHSGISALPLHSAQTLRHWSSHAGLLGDQSLASAARGVQSARQTPGAYPPCATATVLQGRRAWTPAKTYPTPLSSIGPCNAAPSPAPDEGRAPSRALVSVLRGRRRLSRPARAPLLVSRLRPSFPPRSG